MGSELSVTGSSQASLEVEKLESSKRQANMLSVWVFHGICLQ